MHLALMLALAVRPSVPAESFKCSRCTDVGRVIAPIAAVSYDACFEAGLAQPTTTANVRLDVAKNGAVSTAKLTARGSLSAAQGKCVVKVLRALKLPASSGGVRIELGLEFSPTPPEPPAPPPEPRGYCPPPGHWDEATRSCQVSPCAGIPGGCRKNELQDVDGVPVKKPPRE